jgi:hypothetical protein
LKELEIKDTAIGKSSFHPDFHLQIDNGENFKTKHDKRNYFTFPIVTFISSNIPAEHRIEFTFHNSYLTIGLVLSTAIF